LSGDILFWAALDGLGFTAAPGSPDEAVDERAGPVEARCVDDGLPEASPAVGLFAVDVFAVGLFDPFAAASRASAPAVPDPADDAPDFVLAPLASVFEALVACWADDDVPPACVAVAVVLAREALARSEDVVAAPASVPADAPFFEAGDAAFGDDSFPADPFFVVSDDLASGDLVSDRAPLEDFALEPSFLPLAWDECASFSFEAPACLDAPVCLAASVAEADEPPADVVRFDSAESTASKEPPTTGASVSDRDASFGAGAEEGANGMAGGCIDDQPGW
jgi:hypothetical protein